MMNVLVSQPENEQNTITKERKKLEKKSGRKFAEQKNISF